MELPEVERRFLRSTVWREVVRRQVLPWVLDEVGMPQRAEVLELGAGAGYDAETFLDRYPNWRLTATDFDAELIAQTAPRLARFGERARAERIEGIELPYADGSYDVVISLGVWHRAGAWEKALGEVARVLRPRGRLLLVDLLPGFFSGRLAKLVPAERTYTMAELRPQLTDAGFARFRIKAAGRLWYRLIAEMGDDAPTSAA